MENKVSIVYNDKCSRCMNWERKWYHKPLEKEGDYMRKCFFCGNIKNYYTNKEGPDNLRKDFFNNEKIKKTRMRCSRCCEIRDMSLEIGPKIISGWLITTCFECGKRHDVWPNDNNYNHISNPI